MFSCSEVYGSCSAGCGIEAVEGVPIASILGDQQAALFGQAGFEIGDAKVRFYLEVIVDGKLRLVCNINTSLMRHRIAPFAVYVRYGAVPYDEYWLRTARSIDSWTPIYCRLQTWRW